MPLDAMTLAQLELYTVQPPATEAEWYSPWTAILTSLFPSTEGYAVSPQRRPHPFFEVRKLVSTAPFTLWTVLVVEIKKDYEDWESAIPALEWRLSKQTDAAFARTAHTKVYWIGTIGPHWRYGEREDGGPGLQALIDWHHTTHDPASFNDLQALVHLVGAL